MKNTNLNIYVKDNNTYINIPKQILDQGDDIVSDYVKIHTEIELLKACINEYLFKKDCSSNHHDIMNKIVKIKKIESAQEILPLIGVDLHDIEERLITLCASLSIDAENLATMRDELSQDFIRTSHSIENIIDEDYTNKLIDSVKNEHMYSLNMKSIYGTMSSDYNLKNIDDIVDLNENEINGRYAPILVIHKPAKYHRGSYILDNTAYVYIKRQPLNALINQEKLREKGIDGMGAIFYKKLSNHLTNENLQELLAELYVYSQQNNINFENIKLSDIGANKVWMTADKLKKEFKELRYYNKNLSQKLREIYDTTGSYYTQIGGKYIFNTRTFLSNYKAYKDRDING